MGPNSQSDSGSGALVVMLTHLNPVSTSQVSLEPVSTLASKVSVPNVTVVANSSPMKRDTRVVLCPGGILPGLFSSHAALWALYPFELDFLVNVRTLEVTEFALAAWKAVGLETFAWMFRAPIACGATKEATRSIVEENNIAKHKL